MKRTKKEIEDAKKISTLLSEVSEESKTMVFVYLSALRDKEVADSARQLQGGRKEDENAVFV